MSSRHERVESRSHFSLARSDLYIRRESKVGRVIARHEAIFAYLESVCRRGEPVYGRSSIFQPSLAEGIAHDLSASQFQFLGQARLVGVYRFDTNVEPCSNLFIAAAPSAVVRQEYS